MSSLFSPIAAMVVNVGAQVILFRVRGGTHYFRSITEAFSLGGVALVAGEAFLVASNDMAVDRLILALAVNLPTYICLSYCYYNFVQLGQTSIRIRMYSEIAERESGVMLSEMEQEYSEEGLTEVRLQRLIESGDMIVRDNTYFIGRKRLLLITKIIFVAKHFLLRKKSEFE